MSTKALSLEHRQLNLLCNHDKIHAYHLFEKLQKQCQWIFAFDFCFYDKQLLRDSFHFSCSCLVQIVLTFQVPSHAVISHQRALLEFAQLVKHNLKKHLKLYNLRSTMYFVSLVPPATSDFVRSPAPYCANKCLTPSYVLI